MLMAACLVAGCRPAPNAAQDSANPPPLAQAQKAGWDLQRNSDEAALTLNDDALRPVMRIICATGAKLLVNVPAFRPIGSEERLSFGSGKGSLALVADTGGDKARGGVTGEGPIPDELKELIIAPLSASYGPQSSGPHDPPADSIAGPFLSACLDFQTEARIDATKPKPGTSPCHVQDGVVLNVSPLKAVGTEPFWAAQIDGRCVTYSTPEDQKGTRIWTQIGNGPMGGIWVGTYKGKPFRLVPIPVPSCSDGMSDKVYSMKVDLLVEGETRTGCAEPLVEISGRRASR